MQNLFLLLQGKSWGCRKTAVSAYPWHTFSFSNYFEFEFFFHPAAWQLSQRFLPEVSCPGPYLLNCRLSLDQYRKRYSLRTGETDRPPFLWSHRVVVAIICLPCEICTGQKTI